MVEGYSKVFRKGTLELFPESPLSSNEDYMNEDLENNEGMKK